MMCPIRGLQRLGPTERQRGGRGTGMTPVPSQTSRGMRSPRRSWPATKRVATPAATANPVARTRLTRRSRMLAPPVRHRCTYDLALTAPFWVPRHRSAPGRPPRLRPLQLQPATPGFVRLRLCELPHEPPNPPSYSLRYNLFQAATPVAVTESAFSRPARRRKSMSSVSSTELPVSRPPIARSHRPKSMSPVSSTELPVSRPPIAMSHRPPIAMSHRPRVVRRASSAAPARRKGPPRCACVRTPPSYPTAVLADTGLRLKCCAFGETVFNAFWKVHTQALRHSCGPTTSARSNRLQARPTFSGAPRPPV